MKNLNPSQMFFWKPSKDDLSYRNVRELLAKKIKENCHSQMLTSTTRGKQLERNSLTFLPPLKKLNSRVVKYLRHKHEQKYWILKKAEHQSPWSKHKPSKILQEKLNFLQILSLWKKPKFGKDTNEQKKTQPSEILSPDYNTKFWKFTLSSVL